MQHIVEKLAAYAVREQTARLPDAAWHHARRAVVDWFAALIAGSASPPATLLLDALADEIGHGRATLYCGHGLKAPVRTAALINAAGSHIVEFDDIFRDAAYHPGSPTIAAALAAAQSTGADGEAFLRAVIVGYEISTRIGVAVQPAHYKYWHTTGTIGTFGAAAAVATILKLDATQIAHALANATTFAAGLQQAYLSEAMSKPMHAGHAAEAGALAALGAGKGVTGSLDILEGRIGFGVAMSRDVDWSVATAGLGETYNITAVTFKNHGACGHTFAPIDGTLTLKKAHGFSAGDVDRVTVATYKPGVDITNRHNVETAFDARFSTPFTVATALLHGSVRLDAFAPERIADPAIRALSDRIDMVVDPGLDAEFPGRRAARVSVALKDGRRFEHYQPTRKGDPDAPLTDDELVEKYLELSTPIVGAPAAKALLEQLWAIGPGTSTDLAL